MSRRPFIAAALLSLSLLPRTGFCFGELDDPGPLVDSRPGTAWSSFSLSYVRFTRFYGEDRTARSLNTAYSGLFGEGKGVTLDATVVDFAGRYVLGPGLSAGLRVPLVRNSRSGHVPIAAGVEESVYAEGSAIGDIVADASLSVPFPDTNSFFGVSAAVQLPSGKATGLGSDELPTGSGALGVGGELFALARGTHLEAGGAAGILLQLPRRQAGGDVDLGDPIWGRFFVDGRVWPERDGRAGIEVLGLAKSADRVGGAPATSLSAGGTPGSPSPSSSLWTVSPFFDVRASSASWVRVSVSNPASGWLFVPVETGFAIRGRNVLAPDAQVRLSVLARF